MQPVTPQRAWEVFERADCLYDQGAVEAALDRLAAAMTEKLSGADPLMVCILNGAIIPFGRLLPRLPFPLQTDYVHATRYKGGLRGGELHWSAGPSVSPEGRVVVLVDDILDEGGTLAAIEAHYRQAGAKAVYKAVLVSKQRSRTIPVTVDFLGLEVPDRYVFGYGMDYKNYLRNAPGIYAVAAADDAA